MTAETQGHLVTLVRHMAYSLVSEPGSIHVSAADGDNPDHIVITVNAGQQSGFLIGKCGRTARSLRVILNGAARSLSVRASLNIAENPFDRSPK